MFYKNGEWLDYLYYVVDLVKKDFKIKKANVEVELDGQDVVLNFLHMYHVDLKTGSQQPIAWIHEKGNYFFPEVYTCSTEELSKMTQYGLCHYGLSQSKGIYVFGVHLTAVTHPYAWLVCI
jgi:hypothetical protein